MSRTHVVLRYISGKGWELEDKKSKFGTLVLVRDQVKIEPQKTFSVQIGWTVLCSTLKDMGKSEWTWSAMKRETSLQAEETKTNAYTP